MPLRPPTVPPWTNQDVVLFHGTTAAWVPSILTNIDLTFGQTQHDFGRGFYTTTSLPQAMAWADRKARIRQSARAVIQFTVQRLQLGDLLTLCFVRGDKQSRDYWSLVHHCRATPNATHSPDGMWYDLVAGPVSASPNKLEIHKDYDQFSFHTPKAVALLDTSPKVRIL
jgi:Protein of unknown function (DUF3990)